MGEILLSLEFKILSAWDSNRGPVALIQMSGLLTLQPDKKLFLNITSDLSFNFHLGCIAQWKHSSFPPSNPRIESRLSLNYFSLTVLRLKPYSAKPRISLMQLAVMSKAKYYKKVSFIKLALLLKCLISAEPF